MLTVVPFVGIEGLSGILVLDGVGCVLGRWGLVVLVPAVAEPASVIVVLRLLLAVVVLWTAVVLWAAHHPACAVAGLETAAAAAAIVDTGPRDTDEEDANDDYGSHDPTSPVVPSGCIAPVASESVARRAHARKVSVRR